MSTTDEEQEKLDQILLHIHEASMSHNPDEACHGRIAKVMFTAMAQALVEESERETNSLITYEAFVRALYSMHSSFLVMMQDAHQSAMPPDILDQCLREYSDNIRTRVQRDGERYPKT